MAFYQGQGGAPGLSGPGNQAAQLVRTGAGSVTLQPQTLFGQLQFAPTSQAYQVDQSSHLQLLQQQQQQQQQQAAANQSSYQNLQVTSFLSDQLAAAAAAGVGQMMTQVQVSAANLVNPATVAAATAALNFQQNTTSSGANSQQKQRVFTGTVTKLHDNFGFIDDEVFFNTSVVRGPIKCMQGDRVLVEAEFNPGTPFKWNATRVQIVNMGGNIPHGLNSTASKSQSPGGSQAGGQEVKSHQQQHTTRPTHIIAPPPAPIISMQQPQRSGGGGDPRTAAGRANNYSTPYSQQQHQSPQNSHTHSVNSMRTVQQQQHRGGSGNMVMPVAVPEPLMGVFPPHAQLNAGHGLFQQSSGNHSDMSRLNDRDGDKQIDRSMGMKDRDRRRSRSRERERRRSRSRERKRSRSRDRGTGRDRSRERNRKKSPSPRNGKADAWSSNRTRERSKERNRSRERNSNLDKSKAPSPSPSTASSNARKRSRSKDRDGDTGRKRHSPERSSRRSRSRSPTPKRRQMSPRYSVSLPNFSLDMLDMSVVELKRRYPRLYIPSELFMAKACWIETFPVHKPFDLTQTTPIHVFRKHTEPIELGKLEYNSEANKPMIKALENIPEPDDTRKIFQAKVLLLSLPGKTTLYENTGCTEASTDDPVSKHLIKLLNFVCGVKPGKTELMAIGGPHSPSLDGPNPQSDEQVLINTAIRNCRALTGIDLSRCARWFRFLELYYRRSNGVLETVVIFIPDLSTCLPDAESWRKINLAYEFAIEGKDPIPDIVKVEEVSELPKVKEEEVDVVPKDSETAVDVTTNSLSVEPNTGIVGEDLKSDTSMDTKEDPPPGTEGDEDHTTNSLEVKAEDNISDGLNVSGSEEIHGSDSAETSIEVKSDTLATAPLHLASMTVNKLKEELSKRGLPLKGLKNQLVQRLTEALENEKMETGEENTSITNSQCEKEESSPIKPIIPSNELMEVDKVEKGDTEESDIEQKRRELYPLLTDIIVPVIPESMDEKSRKQWERRYALPKKPHILAYPSGTTKLRDFDCAKMTLSSLREYKLQDCKEKSFEVSLFAEFFYEMLQRDFAFRIYLESVKRSGSIPATVEEIKDTKDEKEASNSEKPETEKTVEDSGENTESTNTKFDIEGKATSDSSDSNKKKLVNSELLLAFTFFDTNRCGYIKESEFEELCLITGIGLNRSQIRKVIQKIFDKSSTFNYNVWTETSSALETEDEVDEEMIKNIAAGNKSILPVFLPAVGKPGTSPLSPPSPMRNGDEDAVTVTVDGHVINVKQLLSQIKKYETERSNMEANLNAITNSMNDTRVQFNDVKKSNENTKAENVKLKDTLKNLESLTKSQGDELEVFRKSSERFFDRIKEYIKPGSNKSDPN